MVPDPFYELDGQIGIDLPGARGLFTTAAFGDVRGREQALRARAGAHAVRAQQVHGNTAVVLDVHPSASVLGVEADAVITALPAIAPTVLTADCLPVLVSAGSSVAAIHAGWRGLAHDVIRSALRRLRDLSPGAALAAAIGPAAGACCYEVGDEIHEIFASRDQGFRCGRNLDLRAIARAQLTAEGVELVEDCAVCTICSDAPRMYSYRREHAAAGRQGALIWLT